MLCTLRIEPGSMWHGAGLNARHFDHRFGCDYGDRARHHVAVEIEIDYVKEASVGRDVHCGREGSERDAFENLVGAGFILPGRAKGPAMAQRDEVELLVG